MTDRIYYALVDRRGDISLRKDFGDEDWHPRVYCHEGDAERAAYDHERVERVKVVKVDE